MPLTDFESRLISALEDQVISAFDEPVDDPQVDHPYWGDVLSLIAEGTGERPDEVLARLEARRDSEDSTDITAAHAAMAEPGEPIGWEELKAELANAIPWKVIHSGYRATHGDMMGQVWKEDDDWVWMMSRVKGPIATIIATGEANTAIEAMIAAEEYMSERGNL